MAAQAVSQFEKLKMQFELGRALANFAIASHRLWDSAKALDMFNRATQIFSEEGNKPWTALIALYRSIVLLESSKLNEARRSCKQATSFFAAAGLERREALSELVLVRILLAAGHLTSADQLCRKIEQGLADMNAPLLRFQVQLVMGRIQQASGHADKAYASYEGARKELETLRSRVQGDELRLPSWVTKQKLYSHLVQLSMRTEQGFDKAFEHMEQAKSRALSDLVDCPSYSAGTIGNNTTADPAGLADIRNELNWYYHRLELEQNPKQDVARVRIRELYSKIAQREDELLRAIRESEPDVSANSGFAARDALTVSEVRSFLNADTILIEYFQVDDLFVAAVVSIESVKIIPLAKVSQVTESLQMLEFQMARMRVPGFSVGSTVEALIESAVRRLRELSNKCLRP